MRKVHKWKARLNVHGGQQQHGINYWETYAPVVMWQTIRLFFVLTLIRGWYTQQINFMLAYPQVLAEVPLYMKISTILLDCVGLVWVMKSQTGCGDGFCSGHRTCTGLNKCRVCCNNVDC